MAKSNAERQKLYRANLSKDRVKFDKSKQKSRERDNARRKHLQGDSLEQFRARQKRAAKKYRDGLKLKRLNDKESSTYKTRQSFGKAVKRVEHALPKDTNKRVVIVRHLAESLDIVPKVTNKHERQQRQLSATLKEAIVEFYGRDDISYQMPVKRDYISVKDDDGEKLTLQKRILLNTVRETYELFLSDNNITHSSLSLNSFGNLRPLNVLLNSHMSHCSCVCSYHENINLLLNDNFNIKIRNNVVDPTKQIQWSQWVSSNGYMNKQEFHDTIEKCLITLKKQLPSFFIHVFIKRKQSAHFEALKLESNDESIIIQVDYSENFKIDIRDAVQGYFYTSSVVSLFTCYVWHSNGGFSLVFISNNLSHDKYCIGATLDNLFNKLKVKCQYLKEVHMFSDGATQQFNQKFLFRNLCRFAEKFKIEVSWNFFATSHGQGVVDGIGGSLKRLVYRAILSGQKCESAADFVNIARSKTNSIEVAEIGQGDSDNSKAQMELIFQTLKPVPETKKIHSIKVLTNNSIEYQYYANSATRKIHRF